MSISISVGLANARADGVLTFLNTGGAGKVQIYDGTRPEHGGSPPNPVLVELPLAAPAGSVADGVLTLTATAETLVAASGNASWARVRNGAGTIAFDCDVSDVNGSGEVKLPSTTLFAGGYSRLVSGTLGSRAVPDLAALRFASPLTGSAALLFGADEEAPQTTVDVALAATLPALTFAATVGVVSRASIAVDLPALSFAATVRVTSHATLEATLPALALSALVVPREAATLTAVLPPVAASILARAWTIAQLQASLPALQADVDLASIPFAARIAATLPALTASLQVAPRADVTLEAVLPDLTWSAACIPNVDVTIDATLPALSVFLDGRPMAAAQIVADLGALVFVGSAVYDPRVERPVTSRTVAAWNVGQNARVGAQAAHRRAARAPLYVDAAWGRGARHRPSWRDGWQACESVGGIAVRPRHSGAERVQSRALRAPHANCVRLGREPRRFWHSGAVSARAAWGASWQERYRDRRPRVVVPWGRAARRHLWFDEALQIGVDTRRWYDERHQNAQRPPPGRWRKVPVVPPRESCYDPDPALTFALPWTFDVPDLLFVCDRGTVIVDTIVIPVRRVYFVSNSVSLVRLPDRTSLPARSVEVSIDADSWCWGFSASLSASALEAIEPTVDGPVAVELTINGVVWVLLVESYSMHREFGAQTLNITGRSQTAYLASPYAPQRSWTPSTFYTAQQLADAELARDGRNTGFVLSWQVPDWLVPEGAWSYQGLTPIEALSKIVGAVGGYLYPHTSAAIINAMPRYPSLPWEWAAATPNFSVPLDAVSTLDLRWQEKPTYNAVYVAGEQQGVVGRVVRAGTAGDVVAPMIVDPLITHADAARERGRAVIADGGRQALVTLQLPLFHASGVIAPGALLAVGGDWRGLVRSNMVEASWEDSLRVRQTIEVERHYLPE